MSVPLSTIYNCCQLVSLVSACRFSLPSLPLSFPSIYFFSRSLPHLFSYLALPLSLPFPPLFFLCHHPPTLPLHLPPLSFSSTSSHSPKFLHSHSSLSPSFPLYSMSSLTLILTVLSSFIWMFPSIRLMLKKPYKCWLCDLYNFAIQQLLRKPSA